MWKITEDRLAEVTLMTGDSYEYRVTEEQIEDARTKMQYGEGSLEWQPNFGSRDDEPEILNVRLIARIKPLRQNNYEHVLVQLWVNPETGRLYLVDPDDDANGWCVDPDTWPRNFGTAARCLIEGDLILSDLGVPVGRPPADEVVWELLAEYRGECKGVRLVADVGELGELGGKAAFYLGDKAPEAVPA